MIRLEFNEQQQCFHLNHGDSVPGSHGWVTLKLCQTYDQASELIERVEQELRPNDERITIEQIREFLKLPEPIKTKMQITFSLN